MLTSFGLLLIDVADWTNMAIEQTSRELQQSDKSGMKKPPTLVEGKQDLNRRQPPNGGGIGLQPTANTQVSLKDAGLLKLALLTFVANRISAQRCGITC